MAPFSSCDSVLPIGRCDKACQIDQIKKIYRIKSYRFDMVEGLDAEKEGQIDLKEVDMLLDGESGFLHQSLVRLRPCADSNPLSPGSRIWLLFSRRRPWRRLLRRRCSADLCRGSKKTLTSHKQCHERCCAGGITGWGVWGGVSECTGCTTGWGVRGAMLGMDWPFSVGVTDVNPACSNPR